MKKIILFALFLALSFTAFAQSERMQTKIETSIEKMTTNLDLSEAQQQEIRKLYEERSTQRAARKKQDKSVRRENRKAFHQQIEAILTPEQIEKKNALEVERRKKIRKKYNSEDQAVPRKKGKAYKGQGQIKRMEKISNMSDAEINEKVRKKIAKMDQALQLSAIQKSKIEQLIKENLVASRSIANSSIPAQDKKSQIKALRKSSKSNIKAVLSPEQLEKKEALKEERRSKKEKPAKNKIKKGHPKRMQ